MFKSDSRSDSAEISLPLSLCSLGISSLLDPKGSQSQTKNKKHLRESQGLNIEPVNQMSCVVS